MLFSHVIRFVFTTGVPHLELLIFLVEKHRPVHFAPCCIPMSGPRSEHRILRMFGPGVQYLLHLIAEHKIAQILCPKHELRWLICRCAGRLRQCGSMMQ